MFYVHIITQEKTKIKSICRYTFLYFFHFLVKICVGKSTQSEEYALTVNNAVAKRVSKLLKEKGISQYRLEQKTGIQHGSMQCIMNGRNKTVTLSTVILLAKGFDMTLIEFLDDDVFADEKLDIEN